MHSAAAVQQLNSALSGLGSFCVSLLLPGQAADMDKCTGAVPLVPSLVPALLTTASCAVLQGAQLDW
jgi:hypothetical protein